MSTEEMFYKIWGFNGENEWQGDTAKDDDEFEDEEPALKELNLEEEYFYELFREILDYIKSEKKLSDTEVGEATRFVISSLRKDFGNKFSLEFTDPANICGYLFRYSAHGAGLTRCRVMEAVRKCRILESKLKGCELQVVSLGGGPGNDVVGFCSVLHELQFANRTLKINVVDAPGKWWRLCVRLLNRFVKENNFGNVSELFCRNEVDLSFIETTLPGNLDNDDLCCTVLKEADIILICNLMSHLKDPQQFTKDLFSTVKDEALILLIGDPFEPQLWRKFDVLYLSEENQAYELSNVHKRFEFNDNISSIAQIAVLRIHLSASDSDLNLI